MGHFELMLSEFLLPPSRYKKILQENCHNIGFFAFLFINLFLNRIFDR